MKKTVSVHLGRQLFIIEEDAYDRLRQYLHSLEGRLSNEEGAAEILEDIEMRFAELLLTQLGSPQKVVTLLEVNAAIASLGEADEISAEDEGPAPKRDADENQQKGKQFFRDTQNGIVAGVSAGLAAYFNIDPLFVRIGFFLLSFTGVGVPLYFLLWILLPDAKTPADRLRMQGKSVTIDSLKSEFQKAAGTIRKDSERARQRFRDGSSAVMENTKDLARRLMQFVGIIFVIAGFAALIGVALTLTGFVEFIPTTGDDGYISFYEFLKLSVGSYSNSRLMYWGIVLAGFGGTILFILLGFRMITRQYNQKLRFVRFGFGLVFITGMVCTVLSAIKLGLDFSSEVDTMHQEFTYSGNLLELQEIPVYEGNQRLVKVNGLNFLEVHHGRMIAGYVSITLKPTSDSVYHIREVFSANSGNKSKAKRIASHISHTTVLENNVLKVHPNYTFPVSDAIRNQEVEIIIDVPRNKKLLINKDNPIAVDHEMRGTLCMGEPIEFW